MHFRKLFVRRQQNEEENEEEEEKSRNILKSHLHIIVFIFLHD